MTNPYREIPEEHKDKEIPIDKKKLIKKLLNMTWEVVRAESRKTIITKIDSIKFEHDPEFYSDSILCSNEKKIICRLYLNWFERRKIKKIWSKLREELEIIRQKRLDKNKKEDLEELFSSIRLD